MFLKIIKLNFPLVRPSNLQRSPLPTSNLSRKKDSSKSISTKSAKIPAGTASELTTLSRLSSSVPSRH